MTLEVRRRPVAGDVRAVGCAVVLVAFSLVFALAAIPALPGVGAVVFLVVGVAGTLLFAGLAASMAGQLAARRPVLVLDADGVRIPAPWPWPGTRDRLLPWPEVAAAVVWNRPVPRGRRGVAEHLAFLPTRESAGRTGPPPSEELVALHLDDLPGYPTARWSVQVSPGWDIGVDEIAAGVRERNLPVADARTR